MLPLRPVLGKFVHMPASTPDLLQRLPDEVVLHVLSFLDTTDNVQLQLVSARYLSLARDSAQWKDKCFSHSRAESFRRRQHQLNGQDPRLAELRNAVTALPGGESTTQEGAQLTNIDDQQASTDPAAEARLQRARALANWDPAYPDERFDYYEEYIHRHAAVNIGWVDLPKNRATNKDEFREATGVGILADRQDPALHRAIAPLDDGRICIWDLSARSTSGHGGGARLVAQSRSGLLTSRTENAVAESHRIMTEIGAVECVSIDSQTQKGYFAVRNLLKEVDLNTLQISSSKQYTFPITALSESQNQIPITVGTYMTVHLHDPRDSAFASAQTSSASELIGSSRYSRASLEQPGPLSILNHDGFAQNDSSIWVAGRFTSLLNYDRRFFPRLRGTLFSGARIASLYAFPHPYLPQSLDLMRNPGVSILERQEAKCSSGSTILAAAEYKGKGSLELYQLPTQKFYHNRQTASASKLLSVAPHGGRIVFSDGDGHLKWVERDGFTHVRTFNINDQLPGDSASGGAAQDASSYGIFSSTMSELPGQGDIVQKILPLKPGASQDSLSGGRLDVNQGHLLLWTGDGRLGILGFGQKDLLGHDEWHDALESQALTVEQRAREDAERQYGMAMRRALERNADEVRFVRGLGMGFRRS